MPIQSTLTEASNNKLMRAIDDFSLVTSDMMINVFSLFISVIYLFFFSLAR